MKMATVLAGALLLTAVVCSVGNAGTIYSTADNGTAIASIDPATGEIIDLVPTGTSGTWGAAFDTDGTLLISYNKPVGTGTERYLGIFDPGTGTVQDIGPFQDGNGNNVGVEALEVAPDGTIYGSTVSGRLYTITINSQTNVAEATLIGGDWAIWYVYDLAFDSQGTLWAVGMAAGGHWFSPKLMTIDPATGLITQQWVIAGFSGWDFQGIAADENDTLFGTVHWNTSSLYQITLDPNDPAFAIATLVGTSSTTPLVRPVGMDIFARSEIEVDLDIRPGSVLNSIDLTSDCQLPVAILTTDDFNALDVDPATLLLGDPELAAAVAPSETIEQDVDGDGDTDLLLLFSMSDIVQAGAFTLDSSEAVLTGATFDGTDIVGYDTIRVVPGSIKLKARLRGDGPMHGEAEYEVEIETSQGDCRRCGDDDHHGEDQCHEDREHCCDEDHEHCHDEDHEHSEHEGDCHDCDDDCHESSSGCAVEEEFELEVKHGEPGAVLDVYVEGILVGQITLGPSGKGKLEFEDPIDDDEAPFPADFPVLYDGATVVVGDNLLVGTLVLHSSGHHKDKGDRGEGKKGRKRSKDSRHESEQQHGKKRS